LFIYYPVAHWIWGNGWLDKMGVLDFAGGIVLHTTAGVSALIVALMMGSRHDFERKKGVYMPSNLAMAALGTGMLWAGWFGCVDGAPSLLIPLLLHVQL
jgi:ammonium transporter, Amt family